MSSSYLAERILVSGPLGGPGQPGTTWATMQYVLGLQRLGQRVFFLAVLPAARGPEGSPPLDVAQIRTFDEAIVLFGLQGCAALLIDGTTETRGCSYQELVRCARESSLLINISGVLKDIDLLSPIPRRAYLDLDPAFTQLWSFAEGVDMGLAAHTHFVTIGTEIGMPACSIPTGGLSWIPTLQPIVLRHWPRSADTRYQALTTIANWRSYGSIWHAGQQYGQKAHALRSLLPLPSRTMERFLLALSIHPDERSDLESLDRSGWERVDPNEVAATPASYRRFIQQSKAEFGLAKRGYVLAQCGWFSDRSICYLASGRPVLTQDTGFHQRLPVGRGLLAFRTLEEAVEQIDALNADYPAHARAARDLAHDYFDSDQVLGQLLHRLGAR